MAKKLSLPSFVGTAVTVMLTSYSVGVVQATEVRHPDMEHDTGSGLRPTGKGWGEFDPTGMANKSKPSSNGISYHGGPLIINNPINVYYIWYGNWSGNSALTILPKFVGATLNSSLGGSQYFNINTTYYNSNGTKVLNSVIVAGQTSDSYSQGVSISDAQVETVVQNAISLGQLPVDSNGVYFVLTSADVNETSGFCTQYCGWHTHGTIDSADIKYAFVGNPDRCPSACEAQTSSSPNGNTGADGMANVIAHELSEATTDPDLNAWYDVRGYENADKCAWKFGTTSTATNGSLYNVTLGGNKYLIQQNWVNASGGYCSLHYP